MKKKIKIARKYYKNKYTFKMAWPHSMYPKQLVKKVQKTRGILKRRPTKENKEKNKTT